MMTLSELVPGMQSMLSCDIVLTQETDAFNTGDALAT